MNKNMRRPTKEELKAAEEARTAFVAQTLEKNPELKSHIQLVPLRYQHLLCEIFSGVNSRTKAVKAKCLDCSNYQVQEIKECPCKLCPLWNYRPYK